MLSSLASDARSGEQTFEDFCSDFGYDTDSRRAHTVWKRCRSLAARVRRLLGDSFDEVANAEH